MTSTSDLHTNALAPGETVQYLFIYSSESSPPSDTPCTCACGKYTHMIRNRPLERWSDYPEQLSFQASHDYARQKQARQDRLQEYIARESQAQRDRHREDEAQESWIPPTGPAPSHATEVITLYQSRMSRHLRTSHSDRKSTKYFDNLTLGLFSEHFQMHVASGPRSYTQPLDDTTLEARMKMAAEIPGRYPLHDAFFAQLAEDGVTLDGWIMMDELKQRTSSVREVCTPEAPVEGWKEEGWEEALELGEEGTAHLKRIVAIMKREEGLRSGADDGAW